MKTILLKFYLVPNMRLPYGLAFSAKMHNYTPGIIECFAFESCWPHRWVISYNSPSSSQQSNTGILIHQHITVEAAANATGYNIQYLRRLMRSGAGFPKSVSESILECGTTM
jgi:hypothetical protein